MTDEEKAAYEAHRRYDYHEINRAPTYRDTLAAMAMQGILARGSEHSAKWIAEHSYRVAAAMIEEMEREGPRE